MLPEGLVFGGTFIAFFSYQIRTRRKFERERRRIEFLAAASQALGESLDYEITLQKVTQLTVPQFATWCAIHLVKEGEPLQTVAFAHNDPEGYRVALELAKKYPRKPNPRRGPPEVVRTGKSELVPQISQDEICEHAHNPEHLEILKALGLKSYICVPLIARERIMGTLTLTSAESSYDKHDLEMAEGLARCAALAIDNALLYQAANDAVRLREDFISIASHELRTPLASLKLQTDMLLRDAKKAASSVFDPRAATRLLESSLRDIGRLTRLVSDLLDVTRVTHGKLELIKRRFDLAALARQIASEFSTDLEEVGCSLSFRLEEGVEGNWDRHRLEQVLVNLLSNVIRYCPGKPVCVSVYKKDERTACLSVEDKGMGISPEDQKRIFGRFERSKETSNRAGLGLGLYIVKMIVERHGGAIHLASEIGQGSTFTVELPIEAVFEEVSG